MRGFAVPSEKLDVITLKNKTAARFGAAVS